MISYGYNNRQNSAVLEKKLAKSLEILKKRCIFAPRFYQDVLCYEQYVWPILLLLLLLCRL